MCVWRRLNRRATEIDIKHGKQNIMVKDDGLSVHEFIGRTIYGKRHLGVYFIHVDVR